MGGDVLGLFERSAKRGWFRRWLARRDVSAVVRLLAPRPGQQALDVGCGEGRHAALLKRLGLSVCAVDLSPLLVDRVRPDVDEAFVADVHDLALGRCFNRVLCFGVLDYVPDPARAMVNLCGHVRRGGRLVVQVPRQSLAGYAYRLGYTIRHAVRPRLFEWRSLDDSARRCGLELAGRAHPFVHSVMLAWTRA